MELPKGPSGVKSCQRPLTEGDEAEQVQQAGAIADVCVVPKERGVLRQPEEEQVEGGAGGGHDALERLRSKGGPFSANDMYESVPPMSFVVSLLLRCPSLLLL